MVSGISVQRLLKPVSNLTPLTCRPIPKPMVSMRKLGIEHEPEYSFINNIWGPVELELRLHDAKNVTPDPALPARLVLAGQTEKRLLKIKATDPGKGFSFRLSYKQMIGPPLDQLPTEVDYYPPFPAWFAISNQPGV